jgi:hypothetical protein
VTASSPPRGKEDSQREGGRRTWFVPDGFIPSSSTGEHTSHEAICILNATESDAQISVTFYFESCAPMTAEFTVRSERTRHVRTDDVDTLGVVVPKGVPYAYRLTSSVPVVVQHSRLDTTQAAYTLFTTMGYAED